MKHQILKPINLTCNGTYRRNIKKTYKKLVKKYHPDYNMGNKEYENKIKEINQAYNDIKDIK